MVSLRSYEFKSVKLIFKDNQTMTGYVDEWIPGDESDSDQEEIVILPAEQKWLAIAKYILVHQTEIKSIELI